MPCEILVVDGDPHIGEVVKALLELDGHTVRLAKDGVGAVLMMRERLAEIVVIDDEITDFSGSDLAFHLKAICERCSPTLCCMAIGVCGAFQSELLIPPGFDHVLFKPFPFEHLSRIIAMAKLKA